MIQNNDALTAFWNARKATLSKIDDSIIEARLNYFLSCLTTHGLSVERRSDSWWEVNSSLFREFAFGDEDQTWVILVSRWPFFITSMPENSERVTDHSIVTECAEGSGFDYVSSTILNEGPPNEQTTWRSALFSEC
jgi:hypothetical protein